MCAIIGSQSSFFYPVKGENKDETVECLRNAADTFEPSAMNKYVRFLLSTGRDRKKAQDYLRKLLWVEDSVDYYGGVLTLFESGLDVVSDEEKTKLLTAAIKAVERQYANNHEADTLTFLNKLKSFQVTSDKPQ